MQITITLYDGVDLLDAGGPYEVFLTASRLAARDGEPEPFAVTTVSVSGAPVSAYGGLALTPTSAWRDVVSDPHVLVVPGTTDLTGPLNDALLIEMVKELSSRASITASVCTGAFLLAKAGVLRDHCWTTHWEDIDMLGAMVGTDGIRRGVRWVDDGPVVTSAGLSAGIAMALHLVDRLAGRSLALRTARQLEYLWCPDNAATPSSLFES